MKLTLVVPFLFATLAQGFAPVAPGFRSKAMAITPQKHQQPMENVPSFARERHSVATVQTCNLFGLGVPELAVIAIAAAFVLGPQKLAELGKDAGKIAGELKEVPKEFQKGLEEGEKEALAVKEKSATDVEVKDDSKN